MIRTSDTWFRKPLLYPLSYRRKDNYYINIKIYGFASCKGGFTLKRLFISTLLILTVLSSSCSSDKTTEINGIKLKGDIDVHSAEFIDLPQDNGFVRPGELLEIRAKVTYVDSEGTSATETKDSVETNITQGQHLVSSLDSSLRISPDALSGETITVKTSLPEEDFQIFAVLTVRKNPADYIDPQGIITDFEAIDSLVNKERSLPSDYVPSDLVKLSVPTVLPNPEINQLRKVASDALSELFKAASAEGYSLSARSGYRSYSTQSSLYSSNVANKGIEYAQKYSAQPGHSEHQTGLAIDITASSANNQLTDSFGETPEGMWAAKNAHLFGFIIRYPKGKDSVTGYSYEPWHLRYVGKELAEKIFESGLTMEEWFEN